MRILFAVLALGPLRAAADDDPAFAITEIEIESEGRTLAAELLDLDGDGRQDLLQAVFVSFPPNEKRWVRVFRQGSDGALSGVSLTWSGRSRRAVRPSISPTSTRPRAPSCCCCARTVC